MGPSKKFWGSLSLDEIGKAIKAVPDKVKNDNKYGKQIYVEAAQWDDDGISISIWNKETKENYKIGSLRVSQFNNQAPKETTDTSDDLPF